LRAREDAGVRLNQKDCSHYSRKWLRKSPDTIVFLFLHMFVRTITTAISLQICQISIVQGRNGVGPRQPEGCTQTAQQSRSSRTDCRHVPCFRKILLIFHTNGEIIIGESYGYAMSPAPIINS
jgi:hypothetical protein